MDANLLQLAQQALGSDFTKQASRFLGEPENATKLAMSALLPAVLGGIAQKGATGDGASSLLSLINRENSPRFSATSPDCSAAAAPAPTR